MVYKIHCNIEKELILQKNSKDLSQKVIKVQSLRLILNLWYNQKTKKKVSIQQ